MRRRKSESRSRGGCLGGFFFLIVLFSAAVIGFAFFGRSVISNMVGERLSGGSSALATAAAENPALAAQAATAAAQANTLMPTAVAALPAGEVAIDEARINALIAAQAGQLEGVDSVTVRMVPGSVQTSIVALGSTSVLSFDLAAENGRIKVVNPTLSGPLAFVISPADVAAPIEERLNSELASQGRAITDVRVEQGRIVVVSE